MRLRIWLPHLEVRCNYTMEGKIFMMPILGKGFSNANYCRYSYLWMILLQKLNINLSFAADIEATITMKAERIHKNETTFYNIKDFYVDFNIGYASILLEDLFNGDKDLGKSIQEPILLLADMVQVQTRIFVKIQRETHKELFNCKLKLRFMNINFK